MRTLLLIILISIFYNSAYGAMTCRQIFHVSKEQRSMISVVVPVFKELHNGNLRRLLDEISRLDITKLPQNMEVRIVFVVNNTKKADMETKKENRLTVNILNQKTNTLYLDELSSIEKIKQKGIAITVIDRVSPGFSERKIGFVRNLGVQTALQLAPNTSEENHFIANLDADTSVPNDYLSRIAYRFLEDSNVTAIFLNRRFKIEPGSSSLIFLSTHSLRFRDGKDRLFEALGLRSPEDGIVVGGPQIVVRASELKKIGGIPKVDTGEDWILANTLWRRGGVYRDANLIVRPGDRARPEGYDAKLRLSTIDQAANDKVTVSLELENYLVDSMDGLSRNQLLDAKITRPLFNFFNIPFNKPLWEKAVQAVDFTRPRQSWIRIDEVLFKHYLPDLKEQGLSATETGLFSQQLLEWLKTNVSAKEIKPLEDAISIVKQIDQDETAQIQRTLKAVISKQVSVQGMSGRTKEFFEENTWIIEVIAEQRLLGKSKKEVYDFIVNKYPEWFMPFSKSQYRSEETVLFEITKWIYEARSSPSDYITANVFFKKLDSLINMEN